MCVNPVKLPNGQEVACHKCWQCVKRKIDDWTGRCIAEGQTAIGCNSVTLTYGRDRHYDAVDHVRAAVLTYSDVQKYLRAWRDEGFPVRYFVVGEYGSMKGRAHWHILLFWQDRIPERKLESMIECPMWEHGHSLWKRGTPESLAYVTKYIAKEVIEEDRQYHQSLSKYPPLGDRYFRQLAEQFVSQRLAPQDWFYSFGHVRDRSGKIKKFVIQGKSRENFMRYFRDGWNERYGDQAPNSEILEAFEDAEALRGSPEEARRILAAEKVKAPGYRDVLRKSNFTGTVSKPKGEDLRRWMNPARLKFSDKLNVWCYEFDGDQGFWYWARSSQGSYGWRVKIGDLDVGTEINQYLEQRQKRD